MILLLLVPVPAGLFGSLTAAGRGKRVLLIDKMPDPGRKLLITGSGQCNLTHEGEPEELLHRYNKSRFLKRAVYSFNSKELQSFFIKNGVPLKTTEKGKVFPVSGKAFDILNTLLKVCRNRGLNLSLLQQ